MFNSEVFQRELSFKIYCELLFWRYRFKNETILSLAIDCAPWNGSLDLCLLVNSDLDGKSDKYDISSWRWFQFTNPSSGGWAAVQELATQMKDVYSSEKFKQDFFFEICAASLTSDKVNEALKGYSLEENFEFIVTDPDDCYGRNFCSS